jgi:site-specific DNA recombinase
VQLSGRVWEASRRNLREDLSGPRGPGLGVQRQEQDCRALCARRGWRVVQVYADNDISASTRSRKPRPGYARMLADVDAGAATAIVAYSTSRLTRRPREFEDLIERAEAGVSIATVAAGDVDLATAAGRFYARMLAARDASEAEELSERARRERQQRREQGRWHGGNRPYGWERDGMTPRPVEQELIRQACNDVLAGRSLAAIARDWSEALGRLVRPTAVLDVLRNPRIAGMLPDQRPARWPAIVPQEMWRGVVAVLADPSRRKLRGPTRLLTGIARCGLCENALVHGGVAHNGAATYRCAALRHLDRLAAPVDQFVEEVLLNYLARERVSPATRATADTRPLEAQAVALRARIHEAGDLWKTAHSAPPNTAAARPASKRNSQQSKPGLLPQSAGPFSPRYP